MRDPEKILAEDPGSVVFSRYAEQLAREGRIEQAVDVLKRGIQANPFHAPGYSLLAELLFQLESEEEAVENIMSALQLDPQMPRDLFRLGTHYLEHDPSRAESLLEAARVYEPDSGDVAASLEKARLLIESSGTAESFPGATDDPAPDTNDMSGADTESDGFEALEQTTLSGNVHREPLRKPATPVSPEDRDFLSLMGEGEGGTIDEELDSLFQALETGRERELLLTEELVDEEYNGIPVAAKPADGGLVPDLKADVPEPGEKGEAEAGDEEEDIEPPAYERPYDERPVDTLDEDDLSDEETVLPDFYDKQLVEEVEEKKDFFNAITEYGNEEAEEDLDTLFETLSKDRNLEVPLPEPEESGLDGEDAMRKDSGVGSEPGPEELPDGGLDEVPGEEPPVGFGIIDLEREAETEGILEITDEEEYNLARFGFESAPEEDVPVLSDAERSELMSLTVPHEDAAKESGNSEEGPGLGDLSLEDLEKPEEIDSDEQLRETSENPEFSREGGGDPGTPVSAVTADEIEVEDLAGEGIDYSDVLSSWKLPGEEDNSLALEPEPLSIADILDNLQEHEGEITGDTLSSSAPVPDVPGSKEAFELEVGNEGVWDISERETENGFSLDELEDILSSAPGESAPLSGDVEKDAGSISDEKTGEFALPMVEGLFDMGNPFRSLTAEQAALIDDFISGKEPEPEPETSALSLSLTSGVLEPPMEPVFPETDAELPEKSPENFHFLETTNSWESGISEPEPEREMSGPVSPDEEAIPPFATEADSFSASTRITPPQSGSIATPVDVVGNEESLDDLINQYRDVIAVPLPRSAPPVRPTPGPVPPAVESKPSPVRGPEPGPRVSRPLGSYTATMAEIYVSQGLITRAMEIYTVLAEDNPANEQYRSRLGELKRLHEQQSDAS